QQHEIYNAGPGNRLPEVTNPLIVLKDGRPVLVSTAIGSGLQQVTLQNLLNVLDFGMDPRTAVEQPNTHGPQIEKTPDGEVLVMNSEELVDGEFPQALLNEVRSRGLGIR